MCVQEMSCSVNGLSTASGASTGSVSLDYSQESFLQHEAAAVDAARAELKCEAGTESGPTPQVCTNKHVIYAACLSGLSTT